MSERLKRHFPFLTTAPFAHRGLHQGRHPLENSIPAFKAARERSLGIECDVRLSADGVAYVFHDTSIDRLTRCSGRFSRLRSSAIDNLRLKGGNGTIPRLSAVLGAIEGAVPLLIECKMDETRQPDRLCRAILYDIMHLPPAHREQIAVMSFDLRVCGWFKQNAPHIARGVVLSRGKHISSLVIQQVRPDFLAYDIRALPSPISSRFQAMGLPVLSWTVRSSPQWSRVRNYGNGAIFEGRKRHG